MKIGIIGGSFNPPHVLHKQMSIEVLKNKLVDKVIYVPTGDKYGKEGLVKGHHRLNMLKLMLKDIDNVEVSDYEVNIGASYTYQTLDYFKNLYPNDEIYFIFSTDLILDIENWKEPEHILKNYKLIGLKREGIKVDILPNIYNKYNGSISFYNFNMSELSSTSIRKKIKLGKIKELNKDLDNEVIKYIIKNDLYV